MLISHKKKFIFIHIYKNAGTSITASLLKHGTLIDYIVNKRPYNYALSLINRIFGLSNNGNEWLTGYRRHESANKVREKLEPDVWNDFFKFAFVRNPYSHVESLYLYILQNPVHKYFSMINEKSFDEFIAFYCTGKFFLQNEFVCDEKGVVIVDFIGNVENIQFDLEKIHKKIGVSYLSECPFINKSSNVRDESLWKNISQNSLILFNSYANLDFQMFGYKAYNSCQEVCERSKTPEKNLKTT